LVSAVMAVGIGANDASNSWGTTVRNLGDLRVTF